MDINNNANAPIAPGQFDPRMNRRRTASRRENIRSTLSTIGILLTAPLIAVFLTVFVFQSYQVDGASMETTLSHNDRLIVWKLPKTWSKITGHGYIPKRGDIVVFVEPGISQFGQDPKKQLIKRVIGLPGERVTVRDGKLIVYNREHPEGFEQTKRYPTVMLSKPTHPSRAPGISGRTRYSWLATIEIIHSIRARSDRLISKTSSASSLSECCPSAKCSVFRTS
jgi:signal peptidase I